MLTLILLPPCNARYSLYSRSVFVHRDFLFFFLGSACLLLSRLHRVGGDVLSIYTDTDNYLKYLTIKTVLLFDPSELWHVLERRIFSYSILPPSSFLLPPGSFLVPRWGRWRKEGIVLKNECITAHLSSCMLH